MKKLTSFAAICAGLLFVSVCVGLMTAGASIAQGGTTGGKDVRVINTAAEAVPVSINSLPAVQISGTPNVNVSSLPAVQVGNSAGNPVPVSVSNLPAVQSPEETFTAHAQMAIGPGDYTSPPVTAYTVPAGKRLLITYVDYYVSDSFGGGDHIFTISGPDKQFHFFKEREFQNIEYGSEPCEMAFDEGESVQMSVHKDVANPAGTTTFPHVWWTGHLVDAP